MVVVRLGVSVILLVIGREESENRFLARVRPGKNILKQMTQEEMIGKRGVVKYDPATGQNWFYL